ncbi:MAG: hypothetical protein H8D61_03250 [Deltaproteobacteria bacterium]|nr:hypothetical protein [Deltaproteobacteria bacterium]
MVKLIDGSLIKGSVTIRGKIRLSDLFNDTDNQYVVMFDIATEKEMGDVLFVNKNQIVWVSPLDRPLS